MKIVVDMQGAQSESRYRGIGRYSVALLDCLLGIENEHEYILVFNGSYIQDIFSLKRRYRRLRPSTQFRTFFPTGETSYHNASNKINYHLARQTYLSFIASLEPDVVLLTSFFEGLENSCVSAIGNIPTAIICYDLIPYTDKKNYIGSDPIRIEYYDSKLEELNKSSAILGISKSSTDEIKRVLKNFNGYMTNIGSGYDPVLFSKDFDLHEAKAIIRNLGITKEFIFYAGGADPRKNLHSIIQAYGKLENKIRQKYTLVFAGPIPEVLVRTLYAVAADNGLSERDFLHLGHLSETEIISLYRMCRVHIFASVHEGFGLPTLEAMACGAVCVCSNTTSLPEVIGMDEATFDPFSLDSISGTLEKALTDETWRAKFLKYSEKRILQFNWHHVASRTLESLEKIGSPPRLKSTEFCLDELIEQFVDQLKNIAGPKPDLLALSRNTAENFPAVTSRSKIYVDVGNLEVIDAHTGIQRVVKCLVAQLENLIDEHYDIVLVTSFTPETPHLNKKAYFKCIHFLGAVERASINSAVRETIAPQAGDLFLLLNLDLETSDEILDCLRRYQAIGVSIVTVLYDLIPIKFPEFWSDHPHFAPLFESWVKRSLSFDTVICISETVADELREYANISGIDINSIAEIKYFHLGADFLPMNNSLSAAKSLHLVENLNSGYFLSVGTVEPRKNHAIIIDAFEKLWFDGVDVCYVIVGKEGWNTSELINRIEKHPELNKRLFWVNDADDDTLYSIYKSAKCVIAASVAEGFGLPLIEAAQYETPLIVNDIPVFREVSGEHAYYFDGTSVGLAQSIVEWLALFSVNEHPQSKNITWLNWHDSARQFISTLCLETAEIRK